MFSSWSPSLALLAILLPATLVNTLAISYCSSENTAGTFQALYSNYQSNGLCQDSCGNYAFAVLQGGNCWCSNYAPAEQVTTYDCNEQCPGYPDDWCGSESAGLFGYYALGATASGTASGFASSSATARVTSVQTTTSVPPSTTNQPSQVYTSVMTVTGQVTTIVITPTSTSDPSSLGQGATSSGGVSTGKVVGIVLGVALGLGLIIGLGVWQWLRRKHRNQSRASSQNGGYGTEDGDVSRTTPSRQVSQMSSSGLLGRGPPIFTAGNAQRNANRSGNPRSPDTTSSNGVDRRSLGTDQRLNPYAIYAHEEARLSSVSLQDNQDYSRQLRIANPD